MCVHHRPHHSSQSDECALDLSVVDILKQIVGLKDVVWLQAVLSDGTDEIPYVFQLRERARIQTGIRSFGHLYMPGYIGRTMVLASLALLKAVSLFAIGK